MDGIRVGTASWTDKSLIDSGEFYPSDVNTPEGRLQYYAGHFPLVEVDSSYYAMPTVRNAMLWAARTPNDFVFDIKAFRLFTQHQTDPHVLPPDIREALGPVGKKNVYYRDLPAPLLDELWLRFAMAIEPLRRAGKLGAVLFQFPPWFVPSPASLAHIGACAEKLPGCRIAVEFRNKAWFEGKRSAWVLDFEREHGLSHVVVDEPQGFSSSVPTLWEVTSPELAVVRLHGRNRDTWEKKGLGSSTERFNYLYKEEELQGLTEGVRQLADTARSVHVLFNNNFGAYAQRNAMEFRQLLT
ncbi:MAG: hypothetical protein H6R10_3554 [Rhodocyclaceae bacterium]|nr:hypothetical protein [Rhodocyclaceae bacterium]